MFEYTSALLNPFPWMRAALDYSLGMSSSPEVALDQKDLSAPVFDAISQTFIRIQTDSDWNTASTSQVSTLGAMYKSVDQASNYLSNMYTLLDARLKESEQKVKEVEDSLRGVRNVLGLNSSTQITVRGGDRQWIDHNPDFYIDAGELELNEEEGVFRLPDTGFFSSIRSIGGFAGSVEVERQLGIMDEVGSLQDIADGSRYTFWQGTHYAPAPLRADSNDLPWLPDKYKHGFAMMVTYYLDRPTLVSEVYVDPVATEPFDLVSVTYTPYGQSNIISNGTFEASGIWSYGVRTVRVAGSGIGNSYALATMAPSSWATYTFNIAQSLARSISGTTITANSGDVWDARVELLYNMKGLGDCKAGARMVWLDSSGEVISYKLQENYPTGFYRTLRLVDFAPPTASSGRIELGIFTQATLASAFFDDVQVYVGEQKKSFNQRIDRPTTVLLKNKTGAILSNRFSFVFAQRNPRRETMSKERTYINVPSVVGDKDIDPVVQKSTQLLAGKLQNPGPGTSTFVYRIGLRELDLRYREFVPRATLVSLPIDSRKEIRRLWMTAEFSKSESDGIEFYLYPYSTDNNYRIQVNPWLVGNFESTQTNVGMGDVIYVYTKEEMASGWVVTSDADQILQVDTRTWTDTFDGTDRDGKVRLQFPVHVRRPLLENVKSWLDDNAIRPAAFDPNAQTLFGVSDSTIKDAIRSGNSAGLTMNSSTITSRSGYVPLRVKIQTDRWTAHQDVFGKPDSNTIRSVSNELLAETTVVDTITNTQQEVMGFSTWLNTTKFGDFLAMGASDPMFEALSQNSTVKRTDTLGTILQRQKTLSLNFSSASFGADQRTALQDKFSAWYNRFKADGKIPMEVDQVRVRTAAVEKDDVYRTRYSPLIVGANGTFLSLYWFDPDSDLYKAVPRNAYSVDPDAGLITMTISAPTTGFTQLYAHYRYLADDSQEDFSSSVLSFVTESASTLNLASTQQGISARALPVCRNMTDYENGRVPNLRAPNFDRLSKDYYPVIEYYVTSDNYLQFARDFFKYGDIPAYVQVEYDTLALTPRCSVEVLRSGAPTSSTSISSFSLMVKETGALPTREVQ